MDLFLLILFGGVIGLAGHFLDTTKARGGLTGAVIFGVAGSLTGGLLASLFLTTSWFHPEISTLLLSLSGALLLLLFHRTILSKQERF